MKTLKEISDGLNAVVLAIGNGKLATMYEGPRLRELASHLTLIAREGDVLLQRMGDCVAFAPVRPTNSSVEVQDGFERIEVEEVAHFLGISPDDIHAVELRYGLLYRQSAGASDASHAPIDPPNDPPPAPEKPAGMTATEALAEQNRQEALKRASKPLVPAEDYDPNWGSDE
jgi:hypothetical protein